MKAIKYSASEVKKIDLDTKQIYKYPSPTKEMDIARMVVKGRHPKDPKPLSLNMLVNS